MATNRSHNVLRHATGYAKAEKRTIEFASKTQQEVFNYGPYPQCASGGFGSAKSWAFCLKALKLSDFYPNNRGIIARKVHEELKHTTMSTFFKICPPEAYMQGGRRSDSEKHLRLNNGSEVLWMHMDNPETENVIRGLEINWFFVDQAEELEEEIFEMLMARLGRWDKAEVSDRAFAEYGRFGSGRITFADAVEVGRKHWPWRNEMTGQYLAPTFPMIACNPDTEVHWIYRRFHPDSDEFHERYKKLNYKMFLMSTADNKFLPQQNKEALLDRDPTFVRRFFHGEWGIPEGQIHKIDDLSIIEGNNDHLDHLRRTCALHRSMDHGDASPTAVLWVAIDRDGNVVVFREYYAPNRVISEHRAEIYVLSQINSQHQERYRTNLADPSIFHLTQQKYGGQWSTADEYLDITPLSPRHNRITWQPADNNELGTRNRINEYLRVDPDRVNPFTGEKGSPRLFFLKANENYPNGCKNVLRETRAQRRIKIGTDLGRPIFADDRDDKIPDHAYDPLRYFIASRPAVASLPSVARHPGSFDAVAEDYDRFIRKGGFRMQARLQRRRAAAFGLR